ncbi:MAG: endonuclease [Hyphomicrobiales bacterium]|nr:MAG: endonuclease [Hyphomicrobiales bacterium]
MVGGDQIVEQYGRRPWTDFIMRVASYNIRKSVGLDRKRNPERILDVLNEINADVVFLQEVDRRIGERASTLSSELLAQHTDYHAADITIREHSLGWHGNAILVRKEIEFQKAWRIELPTLEPRGAIAADILVAGTTVRCVATHLGLIARIRKAQIKKIANALHLEPDDPPTIIAGDFNEWRKSDIHTELFGDGYKMIDPQPSFHSALPFAALDRIVISKDIEFLKSDVHRSKKSKVASDHLPIWADLKLPQD